MKFQRLRGFTLIEMMIVVAIVGVLGAIAYPAYTSSVQKGRRAQARTELMSLMQQQERFATQNNTYLAFTSTLNGTVVSTVPINAATIFKVYAGEASSNSQPYYILSAGLCTANPIPTIADCVRLSATPTIADSIVNVLSVTSTGVKTCTGTASSTDFKLCWP